MHPEHLCVTALAEWLELAYLQDRHGGGGEVFPCERRAIAAHLRQYPARGEAVRAVWRALLAEQGGPATGDAEFWLEHEFTRGGQPAGRSGPVQTPDRPAAGRWRGWWRQENQTSSAAS